MAQQVLHYWQFYAAFHEVSCNYPGFRTIADFQDRLCTWIYAGGAHHTGYSYCVTAEHMEDFAEIAGVELVVIGAATELRGFKQELRQNEVYYHIAPGLGRL